MATRPPETVVTIEEEVEESAYTPDGYEDEAEFLAEARELYTQDRDANRLNDEASLDDLKFYSGDQWDRDEMTLRMSLGQPCITINTLPQLIGQVVGDWRANEVAIKILPREDSDVDLAEVREDLIRAIETQSNAPQVYARTFEQQVACGVGNFRIDLDYADNDVFDRDVFIRPINNPLAVTWDYMSIDPTGRDAEHCFVEDILPRKVFEKRWPDKQPSEMGEKIYNECIGAGWVSVDTVKITEYWRIIRKPRTLAMMQDGSTLDVTDKEPENWVPNVMLDNGHPLVRVVQRKYAQMHFITGFAILEGPFELPISRLPIIRMMGREVPVGDARSRFSLIRFAKDPQRLKNYWNSVVTEVVSKAPRNQWLARASAVEGREQDFREAHLSGDPLVVINDKATADPIPMPPAPVPVALLQLGELMSQHMKDTTGIQDASLGIKSNETSGIAIQARQSQGDISTMTFTDNAVSAIREGGSVVNELLPVTYDSVRTARLVGPDGEARLQRINDPNDPDSVDLSKGKFDTIVSSGPAYETRRQAAAAGMVEMIRAAPQLMGVAGDLLVKALDVPDADEIAERVKRTIPSNITGDDENQQQPTPQQQQVLQLQQQAQQLQQRKIEAEVMEAEAKAQEAQARARQADAQARQAQAESQKADAQAQGAAAEAIGSVVKTMHTHAELQAHHAHTINALSGLPAPAARTSPQTGNAPAAKGRRPRRRK